MYRRRFVASVAAGAVAATAGCLGGLAEFEATPVAVSADALEEAGYALEATRALVVTESILGQEVRAINYVSEYRRRLGIDLLSVREAGVFAVVSSPRVAVAGRDLNPIADYDDAEVAALIQDRYEELSIGPSVGVRSTEALGRSADVTTFEAEGRLAEIGALDLYVDVCQLDTDDEHVVGVGVYPRLLADEDERVTALVRGLRLDANVEVDEEVEGEFDGGAG